MEWRRGERAGNIEDRRGDRDPFHRQYGRASDAWLARNLTDERPAQVGAPTHNGTLVRVRVSIPYVAADLRKWRAADDGDMNQLCAEVLKDHRNGMGLEASPQRGAIVIDLWCASLWLGPVLRWREFRGDG